MNVEFLQLNSLRFKITGLLSRATSVHKSVKTLVLIGLIAIILSWFGYLIYQDNSVNYAEEAAKPLEIALLKAGASKVASTGDAGRGPDNNEPWYDVIFETSLSREDAINLVKKVANENDFALVHATSSNRGPLGAVADTYIDNWYYDNVSKSATYPGLSKGNIQLAMAVNYKQEKGAADPSPTTIRLNMRLPVFK